MMNFLRSACPNVFIKIRKILRPSTDPTKDRRILLSGKSISVGCYTYGYENTQIFSWDEQVDIIIGRYCSIAFGLKLFCGGSHRTDWITTFPFGHIHQQLMKIEAVKGTPKSNGNISIGNDVWIGRDVTILSGITIGDGAVIAANSHVVSNVEPYTIVGGNPAKKIKQRFSDEIISRLLLIKWWDYPIEKINHIIPFLCNQYGENISDNLTHIELILKNNLFGENV